MLCHSGQHMQREPIRLRHVGEDEVDICVHQMGDEFHIATQPVELPDTHHAPYGTRSSNCLPQLWTIGFSPRFSLDVLTLNRSPDASGVISDQLALRFKSEPRLALATR